MDIMEAGYEILVLFFSMDGIVTPEELICIREYLESHLGKKIGEIDIEPELRHMSFSELQARFEEAANKLMISGTETNRNDIFHYIRKSKKPNMLLSADEKWMIQTLEHFWGVSYGSSEE